MGEKTRINQTDKILAYMKKNGSITPLDALREFGCMRLAARIADLKHDGHQIGSRTKYSISQCGEKVRFAEYLVMENK